MILNVHIYSLYPVWHKATRNGTPTPPFYEKLISKCTGGREIDAYFEAPSQLSVEGTERHYGKY
jgi:hypothetical protein